MKYTNHRLVSSCSTSRFLEASCATIHQLTHHQKAVFFGRIRGTGPGVHFDDLLTELDAHCPADLKFPFEDSHHVGGGLWGDPPNPFKLPAIAKLHWLPHANDLPMHTHEHSDRFIIVIGGRGFFHWTDHSLSDFDGSGVHTIAARDRDVFVFQRGLLHTFSTHDEPMTLLSVQSPYIPFDDERQYTLPSTLWTACDGLAGNHEIQCVLTCSGVSIQL